MEYLGLLAIGFILLILGAAPVPPHRWRRFQRLGLQLIRARRDHVRKSSKSQYEERPNYSNADSHVLLQRYPVPALPAYVPSP